MTDTRDAEQDVALEALNALAHVAQSSAEDLNAINDDLDTMRRQRAGGWSWRRIMASSDSPNALAAMSAVAANLGRACGEFRRAIARSLRSEGMRTPDMGTLLEVSRQRVSALLHPKHAD